MTRLVACLCIALGCGGCPSPQEPTRKEARAPAPAQRTQPRVLLLGDSISIGYAPHVRGALKGTAHVDRPDGNHRSTWEALASLDQWLGDDKWDVVHFNFGLHDMYHVNENGQVVSPAQGAPRSSLADYENSLRRIVARLERTKAALVFATSTPALTDTPTHRSGVAARYNEAATSVMRSRSVAINDLHEFTVQQPELQLPGDLHFTPDGYERLGAQVVAAIKDALHPDVLGPGDYQENHPAIRFEGTWETQRGDDYLGGHRVVGTSPDAWAAFSFRGTGVVIYREHGTKGGKMELCVDDQCRTVSNHFFRDFGTQPYGMQSLAPGVHRARVKKIDGNSFDLDAVRVYDDTSSRPLQGGTYEENDPAIRYHGSWIRQRRQERPGPRDGWVFTSLDRSARATVKFSGTGLVVYRGIYDDRLESELCVDTGRCARESSFSDALFWRQPMLLVGLDHGVHEVTLRSLSGRAFDVEEIEVIGPPKPLAEGSHRASHPSIHYFGEWSEQTFDDSPLDDRVARRSRSPRAAVYFSAVATEIALLLPHAFDRGTVELCVNHTCRRHSLNTGFERPHLGWKSTGKLGRGLQHIVLRKIDGRYLDLAGVRVIDEPEAR